MWQKIQKKLFTLTGMLLSGFIPLIIIFISFLLNNSILQFIGWILLLIFFSFILYVHGPFKYTTRDSNYYQEIFLSKANKFFTLYFFFVILLILVIIFNPKSGFKLEFGSIGTWASAIASSSAVIVSLYKTFHVEYPKLITKTKNISTKNDNYVELDIDIQNIDKRDIVLKCFLTQGVYYALPTNGNWSNRSSRTIDPKKIDTNALTVDKDLRKQIMQPILKLDSFTNPNARNKNGTLHLFLDKDTKSFTVALRDIYHNKDVYIRGMKIRNWKIGI